MTFIYVCLCLAALAVLVPVINVIASSFSSPRAIAEGRVSFLPVEPTLVGYTMVLSSKAVQTGFLNSLFYTTVGTAVSVILTVLAAYPLSRRDMYGRGVLMFLFVLPMFISGGLIPTYLVVSKLGMIDTPWAMIFPTALGLFNLIITRTFFQINIPEELLQAAQIDGCSDFKFVTHVVLALSKPVLAVIILLYAIGKWNSYFEALIYVHKLSLQPLQIVLRDILTLSTFTTEMSTEQASIFMDVEDARYIGFLLKYSLIIIASLPFMFLYPFIQKYFIKGILIGSLKG